MIYQSIISRRGLDSFPAVHILISHPDHVHIPIPASPALGTETEAGKGQGKGHSHFPAQDRRRAKRLGQSDNIPETILETDIIPTLQRQHLIADATQVARTSWRGYILLPDDKASTSGTSRQDRARAIEKKEGRFTTLTLQYAASFPP